MPEITLLYGGLLGIIAIGLALRPGLMRGRLGVSVGDGGHPELLLEMRRHGNFTEWVPLALLLIAMLEIRGIAAWAVHTMGATLVLCRVIHPLGLKIDDLADIRRAIGAGGTALVVGVASIWAIVSFVT